MNANISQAELVIMKALWAQSPMTAHEIHDHVDSQEWGLPTVKTLINRLLKKDIIQYEQQGRGYAYFPTLAKEKYLASQNQSFLNDLYDGNVTDLMAAFVQQETLSEKEIKSIQAIIDQLEPKHD